MVLLFGNNTRVKGYHVQEYRPVELKHPLKCCDREAWLGFGYYFWHEVEFAHYWGEDFKIRKNDPGAKSDSYDIYCADLDIENCLNTVFNEEHYLFFNEVIEEAIEYCQNKREPVTLEAINGFLAENVWPKLGIECIIYDDKPTNPRNKDRKYSKIPDLYYKKRIQIVVFDLKNISNFDLYLEDQK